MENIWKLFWRRSDLVATTEVERIATLQQNAATRRKEYAVMKEQAGLTEDTALTGPLAACRKRMQDAESAHMVALQRWQNKQSRQRSH